jgi:hypothetical protein
VASFTPRPLYPRGKNPLYSLDGRLGGPQNRSGRRGEKKSYLRRDSNSDQPAASRYTEWMVAGTMEDTHPNFFFLVSWGGVRLSPLGTSVTVGLLYQPRMIDDDYGAVGGMRIGRGNRSNRRKSAPVPLCPPQIPHDLTWDRTRAAAVGSQRLTA